MLRKCQENLKTCIIRSFGIFLGTEKKEKRNHTYKLPLSSPTLQPFPPLTLLQNDRENTFIKKKNTRKWKRKTKIWSFKLKLSNWENLERERDTGEDEWSKKQSKSSQSWDRRFLRPHEVPSYQQLLCFYLMLILLSPPFSFSLYNFFPTSQFSSFFLFLFLSDHHKGDRFFCFFLGV